MHWGAISLVTKYRVDRIDNVTSRSAQYITKEKRYAKRSVVNS
jgi:hypothetical protein